MNSRYSSKEWKMLERIQNSNPDVDILSITALMDNEQFQEYYEVHKEKYLKERANRLNLKRTRESVMSEDLIVVGIMCIGFMCFGFVMGYMFGGSV